MGHYSVKQTEEYAITEQESVSLEMQQLKEKLNKIDNSQSNESPMQLLLKLQQEVTYLSQKNIPNGNINPQEQLREITRRLDSLREMFLNT